MKEFATAVAAKVQAEEDGNQAIAGPETVKIDGREITFNGPTAGQIIMMLAVTDGAEPTTVIGTAVNVLFELCEKEEDKRWLRSRLLSSKNYLSPEVLSEVITYLTERWFARPTQSADGSSPSPPTAGPRSTGHRQHKAKTHSTSVPTDS